MAWFSWRCLERGDSWCTDSSFSSLLVKLSQVFESALVDSILKLAVIPVACAHFPTNFFLPVNFAFNLLWYSFPWTAAPFSNDSLWITLFVGGCRWSSSGPLKVNSVPHYCGFKDQEIPTIYTVWMVIYWNSNVNILRDWLLTFISCKLESSKLKQTKTLLKCFTLHVMNLKYMKVSLFETSYKKKCFTFSP